MIMQMLLAASEEPMSLVELIIAVCVPLATVVGAFLSWLSSKNSTAKKDLTEAEQKMEKQEDDIEALKDRVLELEARLNYALGYIYQVNLRDMKAGIEPIPIPDELNMIKD